MGSIVKNFLFFEDQIDFNFISKILDRNNLHSKISSNWLEFYVLESVFTIENCQNDIFFQDTFHLFNNKFNPEKKKSDLILFFSLTTGNKSITHRDECDVYILGLLGKTVYRVEDKEFILEKGDLLSIKKGELHKAVGVTPRIILSYGIY